MVDRILSEIVNSSLPVMLEAKENKTLPASNVARNLLPILQTPNSQDLTSRVFRFLRSIFCTKEWCRYSDVRENLSSLLTELLQNRVGYEVRDAERQYALRQVCHGDAKEVVTVALKAMQLSIKDLGLSSQKQQKLSQLVEEISERVQQVEFQEDFGEFAEFSAIIDHEMQKMDLPGANLAEIRKALKSIPIPSNHAVREELTYALQRLDQKEKIVALKGELESQRSVETLFLTASQALTSYRPIKRYQSELAGAFTKDVRACVQARLAQISQNVESDCKHLISRAADFSELQKGVEESLQDLILPDFIDVPQPLKDLVPKVDGGGVILKSYLKVFKKALRQDIEKMALGIKKEENLVKLGQYAQLIQGLYTLADYFEESEIGHMIKEKIDGLKQLVDAQLQQQTPVNTIEVKSEPVAKMEDRKVVVLSTKEGGLSAYGVALGALGWVPKFGLPFANIVEMSSGKQVKPAEAAVGTMVSLALIASYVALSGQSNSLFSYSTLWAMAPIVAPTMVAHAAGGIPIISWIKPLKIAAGVVLAGATHQVIERGPWVVWDIVRHGTPFAMQLLWRGLKG